MTSQPHRLPFRVLGKSLECPCGACLAIAWYGGGGENTWGLFQLKRLKSEIKHKFEQKVKNVSINRKHFIDNYIDLVSIETFKI